MPARYVFSVTFRLRPSGAVGVDPDTFETTLYRETNTPGEPGWLFFRDNLWRGELADPDHFRELVDDVIEPMVIEVTYRALETDAASFDALKDEIQANLAEFRADSVREAVNKYFGSTIEVA